MTFTVQPNVANETHKRKNKKKMERFFFTDNGRIVAESAVLYYHTHFQQLCIRQSI